MNLLRLINLYLAWPPAYCEGLEM